MILKEEIKIGMLYKINGNIHKIDKIEFCDKCNLEHYHTTVIQQLLKSNMGIPSDGFYLNPDRFNKVNTINEPRKYPIKNGSKVNKKQQDRIYRVYNRK
jgi:hypothetical protein